MGATCSAPSSTSAASADPNLKVRPGLDLKAEVTNVIGFYETSLRHVKITLQKRANKLVALDARGTLDGGKPFSAVLQPTPGQPRRLLADASDAGALFRLVNFYPNARGGVMNLEVNLDGQGAADRTGTLWARKFTVLGDPVVNEMVVNAEGVQTKQRRAGQRQQFEFDLMRVPFSVGHGQFVVRDGVINGPFEGATLRGKVDFRAQTIDMGGTYVGGTGVLGALEPIPIIGPIVMGPRGEGVFGITYAIKGSTAKPEVIVNPLSLITPGIFREIFNMTPEDPTVQPRDRPRPKAMGPRSSSAPAATAEEFEQLARRIHDATQVASPADQRSNLAPRRARDSSQFASVALLIGEPASAVSYAGSALSSRASCPGSSHQLAPAAAKRLDSDDLGRSPRRGKTTAPQFRFKPNRKRSTLSATRVIHPSSPCRARSRAA